MKKKDEKKKDLEALRAGLEKTKNVFITGFEKMKVAQDYELRKTVRGAGGHYEVVKNNIAAKASEGKIEHLAVLDGNAPDVDDLLTLLEPIFPRDDIITGVVGPVIGTHAGPRVIGVTYQVVR